MASRNYNATTFRRLSEVNPRDIINLMSDPVVRRHLPLARGRFGEPECAQFVAAKERMWEEAGFGPWAFVLGDEFVGWGGLQPEGDDVDVGTVLHPDHWGAGRVLYERIIVYAFGDLGVDSVTVLLPPSRTRVGGLRRLGFYPDGDTLLGGERFLRYRLTTGSPRIPISNGVDVSRSLLAYPDSHTVLADKRGTAVED